MASSDWLLLKIFRLVCLCQHAINLVLLLDIRLDVQLAIEPVMESSTQLWVFNPCATSSDAQHSALVPGTWYHDFRGLLL